MDYTNSKGSQINNLSDWKAIFLQSTNKKKKEQWQHGRSAYELANFMMKLDGETMIKKIVSELINENVLFETATPELETRFDKYGSGRVHDLGIWGITDSKKTIFVGVESKVDESFCEKISDLYFTAKTKELNGEKTNAPKRIEGLLKRNFKVSKPKHFDLRYQLLYSTAGVLDATKNKEKADISILLIIVFKTDSYKKNKGEKNLDDYHKFIKCVESEKIQSNSDIELHKLKIDDKEMYSIYMTIDERK
jgi:hypothetical protein